VQQAGGYRAYYDGKTRPGTLQGGGTAGGLGLDREFYESVLVPQVMIDGFLGLQPTADGININPALPSSWQSLTITNITAKGVTFDAEVTSTSVRLTPGSEQARPLDGLKVNIAGQEHQWVAESPLEVKLSVPRR
jgi:hypothetical protein